MARAHRWIQRSVCLQLSIVLACWLAGAALSRLFALPIPGGVVGLAILLLLLVGRRLSVVSLRRGAGWLLADMLLFFVPAALAILDHPEFLGLVGAKILFVILASTAAVMIATALAVEFAFRWTAAHGLASPDSH